MNGLQLTDPLGWSFIFIVTILFLLYFSGALPVPIGIDNGKIKWVKWCMTGMHNHTVYWHRKKDGYGDKSGFQTMHPKRKWED